MFSSLFAPHKVVKGYVFRKALQKFEFCSHYNCFNTHFSVPCVVRSSICSYPVTKLKKVLLTLLAVPRLPLLLYYFLYHQLFHPDFHFCFLPRSIYSPHFLSYPMHPGRREENYSEENKRGNKVKRTKEQREQKRKQREQLKLNATKYNGYKAKDIERKQQ